MFLKNRQLKKLMSTKSQVPAKANDSGLTLIEGLVAIVIIAIATAVMTPMVILAVGTRVQSQRAEQAFQIAQAEVDRIKLIVSQGGNYTLNIAPTPTGVNSVADFDVVPVPAPNVINDNTYSTTTDAARAIDVDNDGNADYAVQVFKTDGITSGTIPVAFDLGVRVYRADIIGSLDPTDVEQASLIMTSGEGQSGNAPLSTIYTSLIRSDDEESLCDYYEFINSVQGTTVSTPSEC